VVVKRASMAARPNQSGRRAAAGGSERRARFAGWLARFGRFEAVLRTESGHGLLELFADVVEAIRF